MTRTDIHRPSAIVPADYEFVGFEFINLLEFGDIIGACHFLQEQRAIIQSHKDRTGGNYSTHEHGGNCHVCGASCIYTVLFYHAQTNTYIRTGQDCAQKMEMPYDDIQMNAFRKAVTDAREAVAGKKKAMAILSDAGLQAAWTIYAMDYDQLPKNPKTAHGPRPEIRVGSCIEQEAQEAFAGYPFNEEMTVRDIVGKLVKYGSVSEKALNYVRVLLGHIVNRDAELARRAAEEAAAADCPKGRMVITGEVLTTKIQESQFGNVLKMLVKHESGYKVWGTVPSSLDAERGYIVTFTATVEPSKDDPKFGYFSRPTKASVVKGMPEPVILVSCTECGVDYDEKEVTFRDIEEGLLGEDILSFTCPKGHDTKSRRRG